MTTAAKARAYSGPAIFSYGFRPFFLGGAVWAGAVMALFFLILQGDVVLPTAFDVVDWHIHELLYGYLPAVVAGFLLTAVPNWTGRLPVSGAPLAALFAIWLAGRVGGCHVRADRTGIHGCRRSLLFDRSWGCCRARDCRRQKLSQFDRFGAGDAAWRGQPCFSH